MSNQVKIEQVKKEGQVPSFLSKLKNIIHRQYKIDRFRFMMVLFLFVISLIVTGIFTKEYINTYSEYKTLMTKAKEITWKDYVDTLEKNDLKEIQYNNYRTAFFPLGVQNVIPINEIVKKNGDVVYYKGNINEEKSKQIQPIIFEKGIRENKYVVDHLAQESTLGRMSGGLFTIFALITIILIAQRAFADILVGKNFELTRNSDNIMFDDIIGYDEVKREFKETVVKLKNYEKFSKQGIFPPKGMLLTGPPGVGKTLFAKALANECGASYLYATGADFVELYVGTGARRVRSLFQNARYMSPCVIFIDEIDALGKRDGYGMDSERLSTINQILAEMDGLNENKAVLVVAATNHQDKVDSALLRPGRFDKKIEVNLPDEETREGILRFYSREFTSIIDFKKFAKITAGMSGADLKNLIEEAKNLKLREMTDPEMNNEIILDNASVDEAIEIVLLGVSSTKSHSSEIERVAVHELGHAITGYVMNSNHYVQKISIAGRGKALGFTLQSPKEDLKLYTKEDFFAQMVSLLGGRAAEDIILGSVSNGASDDLMRVNEIARRMVCEWGMGAETKLYTTPTKNIMSANSQEINTQKIEEDINKLLDNAYAKATDIISQNKDWLLVKKELLIKQISLDNDELFKDENIILE